MEASHIHLNVRDLEAAVRWLGEVWDMRPVYRDERMASFAFGPLGLILDAAEADSPATVAFESDDCDADFERVVARGAEPLEAPADRPWGVRAAYLKGPGALTFELEQPLAGEGKA